MRYPRKQKIIIIVALVIAIVGMTLGFAAFSTTLSISSSATVTPNEESFSVGFYSPYDFTKGETYIIEPNAGEGDNIRLVNGSKSISGLKVSLSRPGDFTAYDLVIVNDGEYDAYIKSVSFSEPVCIPDEGTNSELVAAACDDINIYFGYDDIYKINRKLEKGDYIDANFQIGYLESGIFVDGPFTVEFGSVSIEFSSAASSNLIEFTIDGIVQYAEAGMTWAEYVDSEYNTCGVTYFEPDICSWTNESLGGIYSKVIEPKDYISASPCK